MMNIEKCRGCRRNACKRGNLFFIEEQGKVCREIADFVRTQMPDEDAIDMYKSRVESLLEEARRRKGHCLRIAEWIETLSILQTPESIKRTFKD